MIDGLVFWLCFAAMFLDQFEWICFILDMIDGLVFANLRGILARSFETVFFFFYDTVVVRNLTNSPVNITPQYALFSPGKI